MKPKLFVGSSTEGLKIANAIQANLDYEVEVTIWTQEVFKLSNNTIDSLLSALKDMDFGVFIFSPDDITNLRGEEYKTVRDNVLFELGLFVGQLGKERSFFLIPRNEKDFHLPTDLIGVTPGYFEPNRSDKNWQAATGVACSNILKVINELGIRNTEQIISQGSEEKIAPKDYIETKTLPKEESKIESPNNANLFELYFSNEIDKAIMLAKEIIDSTEDSKEKLLNDSWIGLFTAKNNFDEGIKHIQNLMEQNPEEAIPYNVAFFTYQEHEFIDEAIAVLKKGLINAKNNQIIKFNLATHYNKNGNEDEALELLKDLMISDYDKSNAFILAAEILNNQEKTEEALTVFSDGLKKFPKDENLLYEYGRLLNNKKQYDAALLIFKKLTSLFPNNGDYFSYLGNSYLGLELYGLALEAYEKGNKLTEEKTSWILSNIGNILNNKGFYYSAVQYLKKSLEFDANSEYAHNRLATAMKNDTEERKKAEEIIRKYKQSKNQPQNSIDKS